MSRRYRPTVPDGQLPAEIEDSIWTAASALPFLRAQPLTGWLLSSLWHWGDERWLSNQMSQALSIPHRSWEKGAPKRRSTLLRSVESLIKNLEQRMAELTPESAARRARALERTADVLKVDLAATPCTMFHHTFGVGGGDELEALAVKVDKVSAAILENPGLRGQAAEMVVRAAETTGVIQDGAILALPEMDPGLDAVLLLMARLDRDWAVDLWANRRPPAFSSGAI